MGFNLLETAEGLRLGTGKLNIVIKKSPFVINFYDTKDNLLTSAGDFDLRGEKAGPKLTKLTTVQDYTNCAEGLCLTLGTEVGNEAELFISKTKEEVVRFTLKGSVETKSIETNWALNPKDHFYGFGERFDGIDQKGKEVELWVENGAYGGKTYKPIPFFMTPQGYGIMLDTNRRSLSEWDGQAAKIIIQLLIPIQL